MPQARVVPDHNALALSRATNKTWKLGAVLVHLVREEWWRYLPTIDPDNALGPRDQELFACEKAALGVDAALVGLTATPQISGLVTWHHYNPCQYTRYEYGHPSRLGNQQQPTLAVQQRLVIAHSESRFTCDINTPTCPGEFSPPPAPDSFLPNFGSHSTPYSTFRVIMEWKNTTHRPLGLTEAVERPRKSETSTQSGSAENAKEPRTDTVRVGSVTRVEDEYSWGEITVGKDGWRYWGVYDGHA